MNALALRWCTRLVLTLIMLAAAAAWADDKPAVRAWLDRDSMHLGETVTLNVETDAVGAAQPDFSALAKDFNVLGTQSGQQVNISNGARSAKTLWAIGLEPKHDGAITIAPLQVGGAQTAPIRLTVLPAPTAAQQAGGDIFLEASAEPLDPYVQQQVRYTVKLYFAFDLTDGNLAEPKADGLTAQRLGQDKSYVATVGTRRYHVLERHYALTPERSGAIDIPALAFRGTVLDAADPAAFFGRGRSVSARSDAVHLDVRAKPATWTDGAWLPAASLLLKDEGEPPSQVHVGEPITRTIRLQAQGLGYEQLPELELAAPQGAEIYPDKADTRTRDDGEWLYGERVRKFAFVPHRAGTLTVPGISVHWWDTGHDRIETATLPPRTITVLPAAQGAAAGASATAVAPVSAAAAPAVAPASEPDLHVRLWKMLAATACVLWLATLAAWWLSRRFARAPAGVTRDTVAPASTVPRADFLRACALGDLAGAERALVAWARNERSDVHNLGQLAVRLADPAQRELLAELQRTRYAGGETADGIAARLQRAFRGGLRWRVDDVGVRGDDALPALYPERD
ncbi:MAG: BatD family protein [Dokdonella sp.]|uniref:BatD family protein n=1 Tax=Dokdonella sp. TaxID=2291710 RepID=UPI003F7F7E0E